MRDTNRIKPFLEEIEKYWDRVPDWRFGQLIENFKIMSGHGDLFYMEDEEFIKSFKEIFKKFPVVDKEN